MKLLVHRPYQLSGLMIISVEIEESGMHGVLFVKSFLKPVVFRPEAGVGPVYAIFLQSLHILLAVIEAVEKAEEIRQVLFLYIEKVVGVGADETGEKFRLIL